MDFSKELDYYQSHDRICVDFSSQSFYSPFAMLFLGAKIRYMASKNPQLRIDYKNYYDKTYAGHMGFFDLLGIEFGKRIGQAYGSENYIPITQVRRSDLYQSKADEFHEVGDLIQRHADRLAEVLVHDIGDNRNIFDTLAYSLRELIRNVFEHSNSDEVFYCAQYWPRSNKVEIALLDYGIGVRKSLSQNPNFNFKTDKEAIEYCLLPGVSGKTHLPRHSEIWHNSGYGLYMINRLARNGGNFVIVSGFDAIGLSKKTKYNFKTSFHGTALRVNLSLNMLGNLSDRLHEFRKEGFEIAKTISGSSNRPPSAMSLLIRRDYKK